MLRLGVILAIVLLASGAASHGVGARRIGADLPPGWASGGSSSRPSSQVSSDTTCGPNSVLLFSARGSGDVYGGDLAHNKIGAWTQGAGIQLIHRGWNVRDLQAIYPAPPVPLGDFAKDLLTRRPARAVLVIKNYRDAVSNSWQSVKAELDSAYARCPQRRIFLAGYSQGAILMRYVVPRLSGGILAKIVSVDLIADPTEQASVDARLQHPANLDGRLTPKGIDTLSGELVNAGRFKQTGYPSSIDQRVYQYCVDGDLVCDASPRNLDPRNAVLEGKIHASYGFELIGLYAGKRLGSYTPLTAPVITGVTGNSGHVGGPNFPVTVHYRDTGCTVVGGAWVDQFGIRHDFSAGRGSCTNGVGSLIPGYGACTSPTGQAGKPGSYMQSISLRNTAGLVSAPYAFPIICL